MKHSRVPVLIGVIVMLSVALQGCGLLITDPRALGLCKEPEILVPAGTEAVLDNPCVSDWSGGDNFRFDNPQDGISVTTTVNDHGVPSRKLVAAPNVRKFRREVFKFTYVVPVGPQFRSTDPSCREQPIPVNCFPRVHFFDGLLLVSTVPRVAVLATATPGRINVGQSSQLNATVTGGAPPYQFAWTPAASLNDAAFSAFSQNPVATPNATTTYRVEVEDGFFERAVSTVTVTIGPPLTVSASATPPSITTVGQSAQLNATVTGGVPPYRFAWTPAASLNAPNSPNPVATPNATTTYQVSVQDNAGNGTSAQVTVTVVTVSASATPPIIRAGQFSQLDAIVTGGSPPYRFEWTTVISFDPVTTPVVSLDAPNIRNPKATPRTSTLYQVVVTDSFGVQASARVLVTVASPLAVSASATPLSITVGQSSQLRATVTGGVPPYRFGWIPSASLNTNLIQNPLATPSATTTYTVFVEDNAGSGTSAQVTAQVTVTVVPASPLGVSASATPPRITIGQSSQLLAAVTGGVAPFSFAWIPAGSLSAPDAQKPVATPNATTTYTVRVTDSAGTQASAQVTVTVVPPLAVSASAIPPSIIAGHSSQLDALVTGGIPPYSFAWTPAATLNAANIRNPVATTFAMLIYQVLVTDAAGGQASAQVILNVRPAVGVSASATPPNINAGQSSQLTATATGGVPPYSFAWTPAASLNAPNIPNPVATPNATTTYQVRVTDSGQDRQDVAVAAVTVSVGATGFTLTVVNNFPGAAPPVTGPGINCGTVCTATYPSGTTVVLVPPDPFLTSWQGCTSVDLSNNCTVLMNGNKVITAFFL